MWRRPWLGSAHLRKMGSSVQVKAGSVTLKLNSGVYLKKAVLLASEAFGENCWVNLDMSDSSFLVQLTPKEPGIELEPLGYEFFNYVLGIMQNV